MVFDVEGGLPGTLSMRVCASPAALAQAVTAAVREAVFGAVRERGQASLVLGGDRLLRGRAPLLAALELPWERLWLAPSDERLVAAGHAERNDRRLRELLPVAAANRVIALHDAADGSDEGALLEGAALRLNGLPRPFDLVLLGLGADGHVAALFPGTTGIETALDPAGRAGCCVLQPPAGAEPAVPRLSLTLAALLDSRRIVIVAQGLAARDALERAALGHWPLPSPLHALAEHAHQPVEICWCR